MSTNGSDPSEEFRRQMKNFRKQAGGSFKAVLYGGALLLVILTGLTSYYTVEPDEEAVIIRLGKYLYTTGPGLHFKWPLGFDKHIIVQTTKIHQAEFGFRTAGVKSSRTEYSRGSYDRESLMLTGDLNVADVEWVVQYKISDPFKFIFQSAEPIQTIRDVSESIMRRVVGDRLVNEVLTTGRVGIADEAKLLMQEVMDKYDIGIHITAVKLQDVNPPERVKPSFNEVNEAKQEQEKVINQAEKEYNKIIPEARGNAEKIIKEAEGKASAQIAKAEGESQKFLDILKEYKLAPSITRRRIYLETMENLFKEFRSLTIVDPKVKGLLPIFNQKNLGGSHE